jgi:hypothetical protein
MALAFAAAALGGVARAQDEPWDSRFDANGMGGHVRAIAIAPNGHVFAGGLFTTAGGVQASRVAEWDGGGWSPLGNNGVSGDVYAIAVDGQNNVYVGGAFTTAGGSIAGRIAMWNGSTWTDLDGGMTDIVYALAMDGNDNVYAGGRFTVAGATTANRIARWDGVQWHAVGTNGVSDEVYAIAVDSQNSVYVGGRFTTAAGALAARMAKWNGNSWSDLDGGMSDVVYAVAIDNDDNVYAGGAFTVAGGVAALRIAKWDGIDWSPLATAGSDGVSSDVFAIATSGTDVYAGGIFTTAGGNPAFRVAKWDGIDWLNLGSGVGEPKVWAAAARGDDVYFGGEFTTAGGKTSLYIGRYNPAIVPAVVQAFTATPFADRVQLEWRVWADEDVSGYRVYRQRTGDESFGTLNNHRLLPANETSFSDTGVRAGTTYRYRVAVVLPDGSEHLSRTVEALVPQSTFVLEQNFPNPFNPITTIRFSGPRGVPVRVVVYDVTGAAVASLYHHVSPGGEIEVQWNGRDAAGRPVGSGVYFYRLSAGNRTITRKMLLIK